MEQLGEGGERMFVVSAFFEGQELSQVRRPSRRSTEDAPRLKTSLKRWRSVR